MTFYLIRLNIFGINHRVRNGIWNLHWLTDDRSGFHCSLQAENYNPGIRIAIDAYISLDYLFRKKFDLIDFNCVGVLLLESRIQTVYYFDLSIFVYIEVWNLTFLNPLYSKLYFEFKFFSSVKFWLVRGIDANKIGGDLFSNSLCNPGFLWVPKLSIHVL
jgi:hypothetical protein